MQIILGILLLMMTGFAIYYWYKFEDSNEYILKLEEKLDEEVCRRKTLEKRICIAVCVEPHLNSIKNLQNKVKTILESANDTNIA